MSEALVSAALTRQDCKYGSSNYGPTVDVLAPGEAITGPWPGGGVNTISGSSVAAAFTAGAAALRHSANPTWTPAQVHAAVVATGSPLPAGCSIPTGSPSRILHTGPFS
ncbi:S8 family serine peptidase [Actinokineospora sp. G85]|uniref:S8 family serine peptidase n=1 Tax=Actinokineospora sp. G85 TaxID=3406626 RepID=UPI003C70D0C9